MLPSPVTFSPSGSYEEALARAALLWGIEREYWDVWGNRHEASTEVQRAILASLGVRPDSRESLDAAVEERLWQEWSRLLPASIVLSENASHVDAPVPVALAQESIKVGIRWEDGTLEHRWFWLPELPDSGAAELRGQRFVKKRLSLPALRLGYHELQISVLSNSADPVAEAARLAVCPERAWRPPEAEMGPSAGVAVSLYGLRSARNWGCGDFTDLYPLIDWAAQDVG
ncbi:MAG: 4-alpha-glucanotransferase, partial [Bryobacteraceae bacterium]